LLKSEPVNFTEIFRKIKRAPATTSFYATQLVEDGIIIDTFEDGKRFFSIIDRKTVISLISKYHPDLIERATDNFADVIASL
jgi:DNA-binding transcriptional ArsR family regulator